MRVMFLIVKLLYRQGAKNEVVACTLKHIIEMLAEQSYVYKERTIHNKLKILLEEGYIRRGMKEGNAVTYYVTKQGIEWMNNKLKDVDEEENSYAEEQDQ